MGVVCVVCYCISYSCAAVCWNLFFSNNYSTWATPPRVGRHSHAGMSSVCHAFNNIFHATTIKCRDEIHTIYTAILQRFRCVDDGLVAIRYTTILCSG